MAKLDAMIEPFTLKKCKNKLIKQSWVRKLKSKRVTFKASQKLALGQTTDTKQIANNKQP